MGTQYSVNRGDCWDISCWLIFDRFGGVRLSRGEPPLSRDQRAMQLSIKVPHALFKTPSLRATMTIEAPEPIIPPIDLTAAAEALRQSIGLDFDLRIEPPRE